MGSIRAAKCENWSPVGWNLYQHQFFKKSDRISRKWVQSGPQSAKTGHQFHDNGATIRMTTNRWVPAFQVKLKNLIEIKLDKFKLVPKYSHSGTDSGLTLKKKNRLPWAVCMFLFFIKRGIIYEI